MAKQSNLVIVPDRPNDISGVVATAMGMFDQVKQQGRQLIPCKLDNVKLGDTRSTWDGSAPRSHGPTARALQRSSRRARNAAMAAFSAAARSWASSRRASRRSSSQPLSSASSRASHSSSAQTSSKRE